jgi:lipopolysaccharide/colanic/teichoic acid biosynthesis glycosyltransferase
MAGGAIAGGEASPGSAPPPAAQAEPTIWGLDAEGLLGRYWAARGVQVVRRGEPVLIESSAELYLLLDRWGLPVFGLETILDTLQWLKPRLMLLRVHDREEHTYRERVQADASGRFVAFERDYGRDRPWRVMRAALTQDADLARQWQTRDEPDGGASWRWLRRRVPIVDRATISVGGAVFSRALADERARLVRELVRQWSRPDVSIPEARPMDGRRDVWVSPSSRVDSEGMRLIGPVWVGAGRELSGVPSVVGPSVLWDAESARPAVEALDWGAMSPATLGVRNFKLRTPSGVSRVGKRAFDLAFASTAVLLTAPIYPLVMLAIWLEDGRPFFFAHGRETRGGNEFPCLKFRSMRKDAEEIKRKLMQENQVDGPQFFIEHDPRHTRVGRFIRKTQIDELPQFFNVLAGHMSIVGPRPSPYKENQFAPAWRDARLSVRPGITGLWQVMRTRQKDIDFQEWVRYDLEYVDNLSLRLDLKIIGLTVLQMLKLAGKHDAADPTPDADPSDDPPSDPTPNRDAPAPPDPQDASTSSPTVSEPAPPNDASAGQQPPDRQGL